MGGSFIVFVSLAQALAQLLALSSAAVHVRFPWLETLTTRFSIPFRQSV